MLPEQCVCQKRTPIYVQATSEVAKARASGSLARAASKRNLTCPWDKDYVSNDRPNNRLNASLPEGVILLAYRNLKVRDGKKDNTVAPIVCSLIRVQMQL